MLDWMVAQYLPLQGTSFLFSLLALTMSHVEPRVGISPQTLQHLLFAEFLLMAILTRVSLIGFCNLDLHIFNHP